MTASLLTAPIPQPLSTQSFHLQPLHPKHVQLDFDAVMSSKKFLRAWSQSPWPADDFTEADNLKDLQWHHSEHLQEIAFTYTVLNSTQEMCIGCVYINPIDRIKNTNSAEAAALSNYAAVCTWWLRQSLHNSLLEQHFFAELQQWLTSQWRFSGLLFACNTQTPHQINIYQQNGLECYLTLQTPNRYQQFWVLNNSIS